MSLKENLYCQTEDFYVYGMFWDDIVARLADKHRYEFDSESEFEEWARDRFYDLFDAMVDTVIEFNKRLRWHIIEPVEVSPTYDDDAIVLVVERLEGEGDFENIWERDMFEKEIRMINDWLYDLAQDAKLQEANYLIDLI